MVTLFLACIDQQLDFKISDNEEALIHPALCKKANEKLHEMECISKTHGLTE